MKKMLWGLVVAMVLVVLAIVIFSSRQKVTSHVVEENTTVMQNLVRWQYDGSVWASSTSSPPCPASLGIPLPVDADKVTSLLYPGQYRGSQFKPHGGLRFDSSAAADIVVRSPVDGHITIAAAYLTSESREVQRMVDIVTPCGMMYRFDHLGNLSPKLKDALAFLPKPKVNDSRGHFLPQPVKVSQGEVLATSVGFDQWQGRSSVFVDFGVYNLGERSEVSQGADWPKDDHGWAELAPYALCWIDYIEPKQIREQLRMLPAGSEGKVSEYCLSE